MPTENMAEQWVSNETQRIVGKLVLALNKDLHSPLTLAAFLLKNKTSVVTEQQKSNRHKRLAMFEYLLKALKTVKWKYGPVTNESMDLLGRIVTTSAAILYMCISTIPACPPLLSYLLCIS